ncbi:MAG TPA: twin-arginine translocase TatA/TatE family subunit, partial [Pyrinomonadaceae bacterium]|nr:twin-arginine translocase TatA/TatE family subunit [Pyrinomonadaceae bacterium]
MLLLVFEFLGTTELLVILVVALVLFGPRRLPELGRTLGKSLGEFKRATDDFKRTWEREVELDKLTREVSIDREVQEAREALDLSYTPPALEPAEASANAAGDDAAHETDAGSAQDFEARTIARGSARHELDAGAPAEAGAHAPSA